MNIRSIVREDIPEIIALVREFAEFEKLTEVCDLTDDRLSLAMFGEGAFVNGLIAHNEVEAIGYALYYPDFSSFRGERGLFLEDIFIRPRYRGEGFGEEFLKTLARIAKNDGFTRINFQVLDWNAKAIEFYEKLGAESSRDTRHFVFNGDAFRRLAD
ncbi:MAG: GNAT family N-acetyltransferase [Pyrinomonadaceae bacterium]